MKLEHVEDLEIRIQACFKRMALLRIEKFLIPRPPSILFMQVRPQEIETSLLLVILPDHKKFLDH